MELLTLCVTTFVFSLLPFSRFFLPRWSHTSRLQGIELSATICTAGCWPTNAVAPCHRPRELADLCQTFQEFYIKKHSGRKMEWRFDMGSAEVQVRFAPDSVKILTLTPYMV